jgi:hypothetical protein
MPSHNVQVAVLMSRDKCQVHANDHGAAEKHFPAAGYLREVGQFGGWLRSKNTCQAVKFVHFQSVLWVCSMPLKATKCVPRCCWGLLGLHNALDRRML